jgi:acyl-CoA thioesterase-1
MSMAQIRSGDRILFQGDSITDAGRRNLATQPLGTGYVAQVAGLILGRRPDLQVEILNRGISGDRSVELRARWQEDCLDLRPQVLSIMIGVNDVWRLRREWNGQKHVPLAQYQTNVHSLCDQARRIGVRDVILVSPTTIDHASVSPLNDLLGTYAAWGKTFAAEIGATWVDARSRLIAARAAHPTVRWTSDGCHPTTSGHAVIAAAWYDAVFPT